jgi:alpha-L-fucosidase 2
MRILFALLFAVALSGATYKVEPDVEYSHPGDVSLKLDAHIPEGKGPFAAVILVHGGGWTAGHKTVNFVTPPFPVLDQTGMVWFTIGYRLGPKFKHPAGLEEVEAAVAFVKKNAKRFHVDPKRIALMGESAGAHLVNLAGARDSGGAVYGDRWDSWGHELEERPEAPWI